MFEKFGEFDSYEEINRAAKAQLEEGDLEAIKTIAGRRRGLLHRCNRGADDTKSCSYGKTGTGSERSEADRSIERLDGFY